MKFSIRRLNEWLILGLIVVLVPMAFSLAQYNWGLVSDDMNYLYNVHPTIVILSFATIDAINIFGGDMAEGFSFNWRTASIYLNVILYLMLGPYLFLKGFIKAKSDPNRAKPWYWYIGGAICIGSLLIIPVEINHIRVFQNVGDSVEESRQSDLMRSELAEVGFATAEYEILEDGVHDSFNIGQLNLKDLKYEYSVEQIQSDSLLIISVSNPDWPDLTHAMEVRPYSESVLSIRN